ncbi:MULTISPECIES: twin-arginine translocase TatA/TatE family subunit [unclassified Gilliamella]|uniref:twin-arginine translocase TatA/TatE family subunit n=1 Tax=unclassified Gilliamella TaxID=2685620 RepID=UPI00080DEC4C|nr:twin-arginine translocase TatA/TatE family subunit [Gilliamella sp. B3482]MCX8584015.1 twin-arginine translocase TatA/TatE family subunit [Gilliamella sp. B3372]MCX8585537.1 twin-arginine translocase TatA/TatE family subunit [Gilliamella sp. B3562]MCX8594682.1 twin-arginine translocase TatA/TatE family subunit [Gilliamella sp. B3367]MCX8596318.1 twin-arginine translocase TatA/TatE family subunit [Gilliamella sp. B3493]MCX8598685.1 twin-arginine translocase TatA/TatE family subunit [Gilliame
MPSLPKLLIFVAVIVLLFGTKKLRSLGSDLGASIKGFKKAMNDDDDQKETDDSQKVERLNSSDDNHTNKE